MAFVYLLNRIREVFLQSLIYNLLFLSLFRTSVLSGFLSFFLSGSEILKNHFVEVVVGTLD